MSNSLQPDGQVAHQMNYSNSTFKDFLDVLN